jgi:hypothetical protein
MSVNGMNERTSIKKRICVSHYYFPEQKTAYHVQSRASKGTDIYFLLDVEQISELYSNWKAKGFSFLISRPARVVPISYISNNVTSWI